MCLYPRLIKNRKYIPNKKNKGNVPKVKDIRVLYVPVGCGKCMECTKQKANEWRTRLLEEVRENWTGKFVTLSFNEKSLIKLGKEANEKEGYKADNEIAKIAIRYFLERWRKATGKSVRHWLVTELGGNGTERIHIHGIIWTEETRLIHDKWQYGNVWIGQWINEITVNYIVKYLHKTDEKHKHYNSKVFTSSGIGKGYTKRRDSNRNKGS